MDTRHDGNNAAADQCNSILERIAAVQSDDRSSDSLDMSSNTTVLHIIEDTLHVHSEMVKSKSTSAEERRTKQSEEGKRNHESHKKVDHRKSGHFEKSNSLEKHGSECLKHLGKYYNLYIKCEL